MISSCLRKSAAIAVAACSLGFVTQASALVVLTTASPQYIGNISDGAPAGPSDEMGYINTLLGMAAPSGPTLIGTETFTRSSNACAACTSAIEDGNDKDESGGNTFDAAGATYVIAKYDGQNVGAGSYVWYIGALTGEIEIPSSLPTATQYDISHFTLFYTEERPPQETPEPTSLALAGLALLGLAIGRRRKQH